MVGTSESSTSLCTVLGAEGCVAVSRFSEQRAGTCVPKSVSPLNFELQGFNSALKYERTGSKPMRDTHLPLPI